MSTESKHGSGSLALVAAAVATLLVAASLVARAFDLPMAGPAAGWLLALLGLRLAVIADGVRDPHPPTTAGDALAGKGQHAERLHPAHV